MAEEGIDCGFRRVANYTYAETDAALARVRDEAALAGRLGLPASFTEDVPLPFAVKGAVRFDGQAQLHALKYVQGLARAVDGGGSFVFEESPARASGTARRRGRDRSGALSGRASHRGHERAVRGRRPFRRAVLPAPLLPRRQPRRLRRRWTATFISVDEPMRSI